jgi:hypothetical protein
MKIPLKNGISFQRARFVRTPSTGLKEACNKDLNLFNILLQNTVKAADGKSHFPSEALPLDQDRLLQLVQMVQMQMNHHLLQTLAEADDDTTLLGGSLPRIGFPGIDHLTESSVSKIQHPFQKTEATESEHHIDGVIHRASKKYDVEPDLIRAIIRAESNFDVHATSPKGAMGLMQLMPETAKSLGVKTPYDPVENIMGGTRLLKSLLDRYQGDIPLTLAAYNWGMGNVERNPGGLPRETRTYIARVNQYYREAKS